MDHIVPLTQFLSDPYPLTTYPTPWSFPVNKLDKTIAQCQETPCPERVVVGAQSRTLGTALKSEGLMAFQLSNSTESLMITLEKS